MWGAGRVLGAGLLLGFAAHAQPVLASLLAPVVCIAAHALDMPRTRGYRAMGRHQGGFRAVATASLFAAVGAVAGFLLPLLAAGSIQDAARYVEVRIALCAVARHGGSQPRVTHSILSPPRAFALGSTA